MRSPAKTKAARQNTKLGSWPKGKKRKRISFQACSNEIHESLDNAVKKVESGEMNPESAKEIFEKIEVVQTLLRAARRELEGWLKGKKL